MNSLFNPNSAHSGLAETPELCKACLRARLAPSVQIAEFDFEHIKAAERILAPLGELEIASTGSYSKDLCRTVLGGLGFSSVSLVFQSDGSLKVRKSAEPGSSYDSMNKWAGALEARGLDSELVSELRRPMHVRYRVLKEIGLGTPSLSSVCASEFLRDPGAYTAAFKGRKVYAYLEPYKFDPMLPAFGHLNFGAQDLADLARLVIGAHSADQFIFTLQPALDIKYLGTIVVGTAGRVFAEFSDPEHMPSRQSTEILFRAWTHPFNDVFEYSTTNTQERAEAYAAINAIPGYGSGRNRVRLTGYYELALARVGNRLIPLFFDYRNHSSFLF